MAGSINSKCLWRGPQCQKSWYYSALLCRTHYFLHICAVCSDHHQHSLQLSTEEWPSWVGPGGWLYTKMQTVTVTILTYTLLLPLSQTTTNSTVRQSVTLWCHTLAMLQLHRGSTIVLLIGMILDQPSTKAHSTKLNQAAQLHVNMFSVSRARFMSATNNDGNEPCQWQPLHGLWASLSRFVSVTAHVAVIVVAVIVDSHESYRHRFLPPDDWMEALAAISCNSFPGWQ